MLALTLTLGAVALAATAQDARERSDRGVKAALSSDALTDEERGAAFGLVADFLGRQVRACERRDCPADEEQIDERLAEGLEPSLDEAGLPMSVQRDLLATARGRLLAIADAALRRDEGEAGLKSALSGSSLAEEEVAAALRELIAEAESRGPRLLREAQDLADQENAGALPGQEVEPDPLALTQAWLADRFEGSGFSSSELENLAEPFLALAEARKEMLDALRFSRR